MSTQTETNQTTATGSITNVQNPLTLVMDIKSPEDYEALAALLQQLDPAKSLNAVGTVHFARFVFLQNNTQLAVITTFDGSLEKYAMDFVDVVGDIFDAMLMHVNDAPPLPVSANRKAFLDYVKKYNIEPAIPMYSAYPSLTVMNIRALAEE